MALGIRITTTYAAAVAVVIVPVALPFIYLTYLKYSVSKNTTSSAGRREQRSSSAASSTYYDPPVLEPQSLPEDVKKDASEWVVNYERVVSHPIPASSLSQSLRGADDSSAQPSDLFTAYLRATHVAFSWTPQALLIRSLISDTNVRRSFDTDWIEKLSFKPGDLVNGVYRVSHYTRGGTDAPQTIELVIEVPPSYTGPSAAGLLVASLESQPSTHGDEQVIFVNETWMWRRKEEKPTLLETPFGKWFHSILARWLVNKGISALLLTDGENKK